MTAGEPARDEDPATQVGGSNVLVCAEAIDSEARRAYYEQLLPAAPGSLSVLGVTYTRGPDAWLEEWLEHAGDVPGDCTLVSVADGVRSSTASRTPGEDGRVLYTVESPQDLTGLGITVGEQLPSGTGALVTVDSLTAMLQHVDLRRAFRFLHVLTSRTREHDAVGHYHLDPAAHDEETLATLSSVFDAMARYDDGEWSVRTRG